MSGTTISALPTAASVVDSDLIVVVEIGTPNVTKHATAAQMRASSLPLSGGTLTGNLTINPGNLTVTAGNVAISTGTLTVAGATTLSGGASIVGLTVPSGGAAITGASAVTGALTVSTAGTSDNQVVNFSQFAQTLGGAGYVTLPGGFIFQWGSVISDNVTGVATVGFTPHFTTACYGAGGTIVWTPGALITSIFNLGVAVSGTQFQCSYLTGGAAAVLGAQVFWWAWGK